jgi:hypothetical protein
MCPQRGGDVLVSRSSARADRYAISVVNGAGQTVAPGFDEAMETAKALARRHRVDAWYTCDHIHFVPIGRYRAAAGGLPGKMGHAAKGPADIR